MQSVFQVSLYLKDEKSLDTDEFYKLHYYTPVDQSKRKDALLFNLEPQNLYHSETAFEHITKCVKLLSQFNVYMDLAIEGSYYPALRQDLFLLIEG